MDFVNKIKDIRLSEYDELVSHDVKALFTSRLPCVPVKEELDIVKARLCNDTLVHERTNLNPDQLVELLRFVLTTTHFTFQDQVYQQILSAAMGSPCRLIANREDFDEKNISTSPVKPLFGAGKLTT